MRSPNEQPTPPACGTPSSRPATWFATRECIATAGTPTSSRAAAVGSQLEQL